MTGAVCVSLHVKGALSGHPRWPLGKVLRGTWVSCTAASRSFLAYLYCESGSTCWWVAAGWRWQQRGCLIGVQVERRAGLVTWQWVGWLLDKSVVGTSARVASGGAGGRS